LKDAIYYPYIRLGCCKILKAAIYYPCYILNCILIRIT